ncbi:hypothetical protein [Bacillus kribbensis]|uniref:hypothetical protein n=1 Tax=Peribacillus kribbensis TaxID=356658 RepID=UPI0003FD23E4
MSGYENQYGLPQFGEAAGSSAPGGLQQAEHEQQRPIYDEFNQYDYSVQPQVQQVYQQGYHPGQQSYASSYAPYNPYIQDPDAAHQERQPQIRELERRVSTLERQVADLNQRVERNARRLQRVNQRLRAVEQRFNFPFSPFEGGY